MVEISTGDKGQVDGHCRQSVGEFSGIRHSIGSCRTLCRRGGLVDEVHLQGDGASAGRPPTALSDATRMACPCNILLKGFKIYFCYDFWHGGPIGVADFFAEFSKFIVYL